MIASYPLHMVWPEVVDRIVKLNERYADYADWTPEDVFRMCRDQRAFIFNSTEDSSFAVVKIKKHPPTGETVLFIWIAYGERGKREQNIDFLKEIARNVGAVRLEMESPRRGFDRDLRWKRAVTKYTMEV